MSPKSLKASTRDSIVVIVCDAENVNTRARPPANAADLVRLAAGHDVNRERDALGVEVGLGISAVEPVHDRIGDEQAALPRAVELRKLGAHKQSAKNAQRKG